MEKSKQVKNSHAMFVLFLGVVTFCVVGYFIGLKQPDVAGMGAREENQETLNGDAIDALTYREIHNDQFGANAGWDAKLSDAKLPEIDLYQIKAGTSNQRQLAVHKRGIRRAFDGAPPTIPHTIDQTSVDSCLACHGKGIALGDVVAPRMSHQRYDNCTQCHVSENPKTPLWRSNDFKGWVSLGRGGQRAYIGAPPTIPHPTWMRESCISCHGPASKAGLRVSHPYRDSCLQCHGPSANFDQR